MQDFLETDSADTLAFFKKQYPKFYKSVTNDGGWIDKQLKIASLFIMGFECFKDFCEERFEQFFCNEWKTNEHGDLIYTRGKDFEDALKRYSTTKIGKHFSASCNWFNQLDALNEDDLQEIRFLTDLRNNIAHDLFRVLLDDKQPELSSDLVMAPIHLHHKIANWWINNFEKEVMPENYAHFDEKSMSSATSLQVQILMLLLNRIKL